MPELVSLQGKMRDINITREIGTGWYEVGTVLLNDTTGAIVPAIDETFRGKVHRINCEILG